MRTLNKDKIMDYEFLKISNEGAICTLTISAPQSLNALNSKVLSEMEDFIDKIDSKILTLIITGEGDKSFVAGADIKEMSNLNETEGKAFGEKGARVFRKIESLPIPVIAAVNGYALGGGCELAMACDIRLCSENARFGQPEVGLGIIPGFSGTVRLSRLVGMGMAKDLIFSGRNIKADEALRIGLVNAVYKSEDLMNNAKELAQRIANNAPIAVRYAKECINKEFDMCVDEAVAYENVMFGRCFATTDQKDGMKAFLNKEKVQFQNK